MKYNIRFYVDFHTTHLDIDEPIEADSPTQAAEIARERYAKAIEQAANDGPSGFEIEWDVIDPNDELDWQDA